MEFVDGINLSKLSFFLSQDIILYFFSNGFFFSYVHILNIIHRYLKPQNFLLTKDKQIKLFGFYFVRDIQVQFYFSKSIFEFYSYVSPEIILEQDYSFQVNIWSLGNIIYELMTKKRGFFYEIFC
jgi:serine/threonine protein kinase